MQRELDNLWRELQSAQKRIKDLERICQRIPARWATGSSSSSRKQYKVHSLASGGGKYYLVELSGSPTASATGALTMPEGMDVGTDLLLAYNLVENGRATHDLSV